MEIDLDVVAQSVDVAKMLQRKFMLGHFSAIRLPMDSDAAAVNPICLVLTVSCAAARSGILYIFVFCILYYTETFLNQITLSYNIGAICPAL